MKANASKRPTNTKKVIYMMLFVLLFLISGCNTEETEIDADQKMIEMQTILTLGGYYMELEGTAKTFTFNNDEINEKFDIEVGIYQLYKYEEENEEDVYMIVFWEVEEAMIYEEAYLANPELEDRHFRREGQIIILTYDDNAIDLFQ